MEPLRPVSLGGGCDVMGRGGGSCKSLKDRMIAEMFKETPSRRTDGLEGRAQISGQIRGIVGRKLEATEKIGMLGNSLSHRN